MKTKHHIILLFLFLLSISYQAKAIEVRGVSSSDAINCNARLSNARITQPISPTADVAFCSATIINPSTIVTAAHCLNQVTSRSISNLNNIPENVRIHLAVDTNRTSIEVELASGDTAVYAEEMATHALRNTFIGGRVLSSVKYDIVILKLKNPIPNLDTASCPLLPNVMECADFTNSYVNSSTPNVANIVGTYYFSHTYDVSVGRISREIPYPSSSVVNLTATSFSRDPQNNYLRVSFADAENRIRADFKTGDSGAGLIWLRATRKSIVGSQSSIFSDTPSVGNMSNICLLTGHINWPR